MRKQKSKKKYGDDKKSPMFFIVIIIIVVERVFCVSSVDDCCGWRILIKYKISVSACNR